MNRRAALLAAVVAAAGCSSPTRPRTRQDVVARAPERAVDAGTPAVVPLDATPEVACVRGELRALAGEAIVLCEDGDGEDVCRAYAPDGSSTEVPTPAPLPTATDDDDATTVTVCAAADACFAVTPGGEIDAFAIDGVSQRLALAIDDGHVEVWSTETRKRVARQRVADVDDLAYLGDTLLVLSESDDGMRGALWRVAGKKLKRVAALEGIVGGSGAIAPDVGVVVLDRDLATIDLRTGKRTGAVDWSALIELDTYEAPELQVASAPGALAVLVHVVDEHDWGRSRAGVFRFDGTAPQRYAIPICEGIIYDRHGGLDQACLENPLRCRK